MAIWNVQPSARTAARAAILALAVILVLPAALIILFAVVPVPLTPLMVIRAAGGAGIDNDWVPLERIAPRLAQTVIAAEDNLFCTHSGFDVGAVKDAWRRNRSARNPRGASTISQQTAKNLFLWPGRTYLRKGLEAWLTLYVEVLWSKRRIMEVYLNIAEWGEGVYGAEAAARHHFQKAAVDLTPREAALLAAVLPNPRAWSASNPGPYVRGRAETLRRRVGTLGELLDCVK